jgi:uracil-DNA glycosylase
VSDQRRRLEILPAQLARHADALGACRRCGHGTGALPVVSGAHSPRVMLVGQAPGQTEATNRRPFAGRAGKTLFKWIERAGLDEATAREHIYIAAVTRCYPGPSPSGRGDRVPSRDEQAQCRSWLVDELRLIRPELVVPVGRLAIDLFIDAPSLDVVIGRAHQVEHEGGRSVAIPLPHPSGASSWIHAPGHQALLDRALGLLREQFAYLGLLDERTRVRSSAASARGGP